MKYLKTYNESLNQPILLILHGLDDDPERAIKNSGIPDKFLNNSKILVPKINYQKEDAVLIAVNLIETNAIKYVIGHSIGGLLAYHLSNRYRIPALMFNPAFGSKECTRILRPARISGQPVYKKQFAVIGLQDDIISPDTQKEHLKNATIWEVPDMGHTVTPEIFEEYYQKFKAAIK